MRKLLLLLALVIGVSTPVFAQTFPGQISSDRLVGRDTAGVGQLEQITLGTGLEFTGSKSIQVSSNLASWSSVTRASGYDTFAATPSMANLGALLTDDASGWTTFGTTPSSANLKSLVTDETGTGGALVFATDPDISISATTEGNIETALDTLANVTSIGGDVTAGGDFISTDDLISGDDVLLSNAGVINFGSGDCTLTEGTDTLTIAGTCTLVTEALTPDGDNTRALGSGAATWSQLDVTTIELANNTANTITASGGVLSIEGVAIVNTTRTLTGGTGIAAIGDLSADRTITLDLTELSTATLGAGSFTTLTFDAGATDPVFTAASNALSLTGAAELRVGSTTSVAQDDISSTAVTPQLQVSGTSTATSAIGAVRFADDAVGQTVLLGHSDGATVGSFTAVDADDDLAAIVATGADGTNMEPAAAILFEVDGATGANDMPGRISFCTTPDAAATPTCQWIIDESGDFKPVADGAEDIGTTALGVNNIFLDTGAVINFENGDVTITMAANDLDFAGVTGDYSFDDIIIPNADNTIDLGSTGATWATFHATTWEAGNATDTTVARSAAGELTLEGDAIKHAGKQIFWVGAGAMKNSALTPASCGDAYDSGTQDVSAYVCAFDTGATEENAEFGFAMPKASNESTITMQFAWTNTGGASTETVQWKIACTGFGDDDALNTAYPADVTVSDTWTAQNDYQLTAETSAITIQNLAENDWVNCRIGRDTSADNMAGDALLLGAKVYWTDNASTLAE